MREIRFDFTKLQVNSIECVGCRAVRPYVIHPEDYAFLCNHHQKIFEEWHDEQVRKGYIKSWFKKRG